MEKVARIFSGSILTLASFLVFLFFIIVVLPDQSEKAAVYTPRGTEFDTGFFYSPKVVYTNIEIYGAEGRRAYIRDRWTFDLAWPFVYGLFCLTAAGFSLTRLRPRNSFWYWLPIFTFCAVGFDFLENTSLTIMMTAFPKEMAVLPVIAASVSGLKWVSVSISMGLAVVLPVILLAKKLFLRTS